MRAFSLGGTEREYISVDVLSQEDTSPAVRDEYSWVGSEVSVQAGAFSGAYQASFTRGELLGFRSALQTLYDTLTGEAKLATLERQLELRLVGNGRGGIELEGEARDNCGVEGNMLVFHLSLDQTHLAAALREFETFESWLRTDA